MGGEQQRSVGGRCLPSCGLQVALALLGVGQTCSPGDTGLAPWTSAGSRSQLVAGQAGRASVWRGLSPGAEMWHWQLRAAGAGREVRRPTQGHGSERGGLGSQPHLCDVSRGPGLTTASSHAALLHPQPRWVTVSSWIPPHPPANSYSPCRTQHWHPGQVPPDEGCSVLPALDTGLRVGLGHWVGLVSSSLGPGGPWRAPGFRGEGTEDRWGCGNRMLLGAHSFKETNHSEHCKWTDL